jgi:murein DD-endopeptidase MepM/ murein hydrolase activator NlpD
VDGAKKLLPLLAAPFLLAFALALAIVFLMGSVMNINANAAACTMSPANGADAASFAWPTDKHEISQDWAAPDPDTGYSHSGMDFKVDEGSKVYAVADGTVTSTANNEIVLKLGEGAEAHYKYLKDVLVANGKTVKRGDQIATSGSGDEDPPGLSGAHIHLEIWADKKGDGHLENAQVPDNPFVVQDTGDSQNSCGCPGGDLSGTNNQQKVFNYFVSQGYTKEQAAGVLGNMISESHVEPTLKQGDNPGTVTKPADVINFSGGWGLVQWTPASKMITPARNGGANDDQIASLSFQLDFLHKQLLGQGPVSEKAAGDALKAATTVDEAAVAFGGHFERFQGYEDPNNSRYAERKANAEHMLALWGGGAPATDPKNAAASSDPCGAGSGNIATVAKNLAWPQGPKAHWSTDPSSAKPEYVAAIAKYDGVTKDNWQSLDNPYTDCGRFVATVVRMSGADPNFPEVFTPTQKQYMLDHPEKYDHWESTPPGGMKPGDILNGPHHTYLYVGPWGDGGGFDSAAGSLGDHVPTADHLYDVGPGGFWVFRIKGATTPTTTPTS